MSLFKRNFSFLIALFYLTASSNGFADVTNPWQADRNKMWLKSGWFHTSIRDPNAPESKQKYYVRLPPGLDEVFTNTSRAFSVFISDIAQDTNGTYSFNFKWQYEVLEADAFSRFTPKIISNSGTMISRGKATDGSGYPVYSPDNKYRGKVLDPYHLEFHGMIYEAADTPKLTGDSVVQLNIHGNPTYSSAPPFHAVILARTLLSAFKVAEQNARWWDNGVENQNWGEEFYNPIWSYKIVSRTKALAELHLDEDSGTPTGVRYSENERPIQIFPRPSEN